MCACEWGKDKDRGEISPWLLLFWRWRSGGSGVGVLESLQFWQGGHKYADRTGGFVRSHSANVSITTERASMSWYRLSRTRAPSPVSDHRNLWFYLLLMTVNGIDLPTQQLEQSILSGCLNNIWKKLILWLSYREYGSLYIYRLYYCGGKPIWLCSHPVKIPQRLTQLSFTLEVGVNHLLNRCNPSASWSNYIAVTAHAHLPVLLKRWWCGSGTSPLIIYEHAACFSNTNV